MMAFNGEAGMARKGRRPSAARDPVVIGGVVLCLAVACLDVALVLRVRRARSGSAAAGAEPVAGGTRFTAPARRWFYDNERLRADKRVAPATRAVKLHSTSFKLRTLRFKPQAADPGGGAAAQDGHGVRPGEEVE